MEDRENSSGTFGGGFNRLISQDEVSADDNTLDSNQEKQQVSMSMMGPRSSLNHYKVLTGSLAVLAVILLAADIGLGVYYYKLTDGFHLVTDINSELAKLHASYNTAIQKRDEAKKELEKATSEHQVMKWELEHQSITCKTSEKEADKLQTDVVTLRSHLPMLKEGCRHCSAGWTYTTSRCYYFAFSSTLIRRTWQDARDFCRKQGGDLAVIDSREKNSGFWIGLRDVDEEGNWRWLDGTPLTVSFWNTGEPNNQGNEDCAATYPRDNPFFSWNDAPCSHHLKWICEMAPRFNN
ncbi:CD209 antigen-like isoform X3 [Cheilinus undulatus]|uniref:CD209 antigen-like isoform X3 n=1 Tax=Cheilinus undulatus TaxID=241271 RepID=UPI001BD67E4A|nr:CD209 antigen-like isoform X3 [Cheilinus undulatus]